MRGDPLVDWAHRPDLVETARRLFIDEGHSALMTAKALEALGVTVSRNAIIGVLHRRGYRRADASPPSVSGQIGTPVRAVPKPPKPPKPRSPRMPPAPIFNQGSAPLGYRREPTPSPDAESTIGAKTLLDLNRRECRWPVSGEGADMLFCAQAVWLREGEPTHWCPAHYRRAYVLDRPLKAVKTPYESRGRPVYDPIDVVSAA